MTKKAEKSESKFTKEQILESKRYKNRKDLLSVILDSSNTYSHSDVDKLLKTYTR